MSCSSCQILAEHAQLYRNSAILPRVHTTSKLPPRARAGPLPPPRRASRGAARASMAADATAPLVAVKPEPVEYEDSAATEPSTAKPLAAAAPASAARPPRRTAARRSARVSAAGAAPDGADAAAAEVASQAANAAVRRQSAAGVASPAADAPAAAAAPKSQRRRGRLTKAKDVAPRRSSARASAAGASDNEESAAAAYGDENEVGSRPVARGRRRQASSCQGRQLARCAEVRLIADENRCIAC